MTDIIIRLFTLLWSMFCAIMGAISLGSSLTAYYEFAWLRGLHLSIGVALIGIAILLIHQLPKVDEQ